MALGQRLRLSRANDGPLGCQVVLARDKRSDGDEKMQPGVLGAEFGQPVGHPREFGK